MTVTEERTTLSAITKPGVYDDIPEAVYHRDPVPGGSLSSSGARKLLPPSCPALYKYEQDHKPPHKKVWEIGTAAHQLVLGTGPELVVIDAPRWDTNATKAEVAAIREAGNVPLKRGEHDQVQAMAAELKRHPIAGALFQPGTGRAEQSLFWKDPQTGVICRARFDWLPTPVKGKRLIIGDYKTCRKAEPRALSKAIAEHGYHQQDDFYRMGARALGIADDQSSFVFVFQEKNPPYLVTVVELDTVARRIGAERNRRALETYARCKAEDRWPGYSDDIEHLPLPPWAERDHDEEY